MEIASLLVKMASTALAVTIASMVAERFGPILGGLAASLPVSMGPAYVFLAMEHDAQFLSESALGGFAANSATILFLVAYVRISKRVVGHGALVLAILIWVGIAGVISWIAPNAWLASVLNIGAFGLGLRLTRHSLAASKGPPPRSRGHFGLALRALAVAVFVAVIVLLSHALGPVATGALAAFPIVFVVMIALLHDTIGNEACSTLAATAMRAMGGLGLMLLVLSLTVVPLGAVIGLSLALAVSLCWSGTLLALSNK